MARKSKAFYENYINRNQPEIIESLAKYGEKFSIIALNTLLEIEMSNKAREGVIIKLRDYLNIKEEKEIIKKTKKAVRTAKIGGKIKMGKQRFVIWKGKTDGLTLPEQFNALTLVKNAPIAAADDAIDWLNNNWPKDDFEVTDKVELEEEKEEKKRK